MKKRTLTLLEIMIVIVLIGLIGSVIGVNMKGSLDKGRAFKTEQAMQQIHDILMLAVAQGNSLEKVVEHRIDFLTDSGLVKDATKFVKDGWNEDFVFKLGGRNSDKLIIYSAALQKHLSKQKIKAGSMDQGEFQEKDDD